MSTTQKEDSIWNKELKLAQRVLTEYYDFKDTKSIEIVISYEEKEFAKTLKELFIAKGIRNVFITYTNGIICEEINKGFRKYLDDRISFYKERISEGFIRITILSPFPLPVVITSEINGYLKHLDELNFLQEYLIHSPRIMIVKPNLYWASRLGISLNELWDKVEALYDSDSFDIYKESLDEFNIEELHFVSDEGTNCRFKMTKNFKFVGKRIEHNGKTYQANAPSREIFTAPSKYSGVGKIVFTKPLCYHGKIYKDMEIELENGKVIRSKNLDEILSLDESLSYIGEVALAPYEEGYFLSTIMDENIGCHIALGNSYPYGIEELGRVNSSKYHIDLVFGSLSLKVYAKIKNKKDEILILKDGGICIP